MLLNRSPSWRQGGRPQPVNEARDLSEQRFGDSDLYELECDIAAMSHDLAPILISFSRSMVMDQCSTFCGSAAALMSPSGPDCVKTQMSSPSAQ